ncbi:uncharacterized protein VP01_1031g4 [Puccinia sorghi]|uniref:DDE Tnp4 domain-containing protein n=1 Tax=Puccinia sorghi TaxID=27349 RepID=A0A0L6VUN5_9BASI|nr:uncharacterized protein VP01_1031g4 [Puccinia sorghi]
MEELQPDIPEFWLLATNIQTLMIGEFLLADSGYTASNTIITAFKRVQGQPLRLIKQEFNKNLEVKHCVWMIKN